MNPFAIFSDAQFGTQPWPGTNSRLPESWQQHPPATKTAASNRSKQIFAIDKSC
jgi:hypothetical protein